MPVDQVEIVVHELPEAAGPTWEYSRTDDHVVGGTEHFTLGQTGLQIRHWRGFFHVWLNGECHGGIKKVFGITPRQYFLANKIPLKGTLAQHILERSTDACGL